MSDARPNLIGWELPQGNECRSRDGRWTIRIYDTEILLYDKELCLTLHHNVDANWHDLFIKMKSMVDVFIYQENMESY